MDINNLTDGQGSSDTVSDEELEHVAGGYASDVCPYCGSEYEYVGSHIWRCTNPKCGYLFG